MMVIVLQFICALLFAVGLLFILIDLRTHFDRSFRFFGISLVLLCAMTGIDLWIIPNTESIARQIFWQRVFHGLACIFIPFSIWYIALLTHSAVLKAMRFIILMSSILAAAFQTDLFIQEVDGSFRGTIGYNAIFLPFVAGYIFTALFLILRRINVCAAPERRILAFHLAGFAFLILGGLLDIGIMMGLIRQITSFTNLGVFAFGIMASLIFAERFLGIIRERQSTMEKLESAYRDLEQVNALKQLGESTAIINHEIKNYMFMIAGNAQLLQEVEPLSRKGCEIVNNIVSSVERLTEFSDDILKLSRNEVIREKHPVNLSELIKGVIDRHYPDQRAAFRLSGLDRDRFMYGDWGKLEQVFVNMFNNSFEAAGADPVRIRVRISATDTLMLVSVEDNGVGCGEVQLDNIFKAFYTTKKKEGGTGLGMSITRTIVESHGGRISAYSKGLVKKNEHGLQLIMTFPAYAPLSGEEGRIKHPIVLVKDGMDNLADLIRVFRNVSVTPYVVQTVDEIDDPKFSPDAVTVLVSAKAVACHFPRLAAFPQICLVSHHRNNVYILDHGRGNRPEVFSEEYVLNRLLRRPRTRIRERQHQLVN